MEKLTKKQIKEKLENYKPLFTPEQIEQAKNWPEPECKICGRVIFCGINELCKQEPCGLKTHD